MEELWEIKQLLHQGKVQEALVVVEELEEMSKTDKLNKIFSYGIILLLHLIKKAAEKRTTKSWDISILNSLKQIQRTNKRRKTKGTYFDSEEIQETLEDAYDSALRSAALEVFEGTYTVEYLEEIINKNKIITEALNLILVH
ncbi:DUF29 family protein [Gloeocapsa sp. PCC 73106]|uniref:DUF29 family protein n=1 Tax=Gloeocapsa sp. PCC 73106 TaxID=102232 RepID=UPI0002AC9728|nr:DUF29 family protein [Gloeocapsa sp. PCC 73106]ELR97333.1 protein of unknown function DUF29 [Gloeocapsa sp. PCC 73106]